MPEMRNYAAALGLLALTGLLSGCPKAEKTETAAAPPPTLHAKTTPGANTVDSSKFQLNKPATGTATVPPSPASGAAVTADNPRPTGPNWVYTAQLTHHVGDKLAVEYLIAAPNPDKAWVGLVPEATTALDEPANDAVDVSYAYTKAAPSATLELEASEPGRFRLRFFSDNTADGKLLGESPVLVIEQWPLGDRDKKVAPYITIDAGSGAKTEVASGTTVTAHYEIPADYAGTAWIGVLPADKIATDKTSGFNDIYDVAYTYTEGKLKDEFSWQADQPGTYVFRVFPNAVNAANYVAESEPFTVKPKGN